MNIEYTYSWPVSEVRHDKNKGFVQIIFSKDENIKWAVHPRPVQRLFEKKQDFLSLLAKIKERQKNEESIELAC